MRGVLASALLLMMAGVASANVARHSQYRSTGPARYVVSLWEVVTDNDAVRVDKRTYKFKSHLLDPKVEEGVLPGETYGPVTVNKSSSHVSWAGSYWRRDGAFEGDIYVVEVTEGRIVGPIQGGIYPVEVTFKLVKRPALMQPATNVGRAGGTQPAAGAAGGSTHPAP